MMDVLAMVVAIFILVFLSLFAVIGFATLLIKYFEKED